jgi:hypothetical protein
MNTGIFIALIAGTSLSIIVFVVTTFEIRKHGIRMSVTNCDARQKTLIFSCWMGSICGIVAYPQAAYQFSIPVGNLLTLLLFHALQFGLVMINHNSLIRLHSMTQIVSKKLLDRICIFLYILPFVVVSPMYFAYAETFPNRPMIASAWNRDVFKPVTLALVLSTEFFACITDVLLMFHIVKVASKQDTLHLDGIALQKYHTMKRGLLQSYLLVWTVLAFDVVIKILIILGYSIFFDSILSVCTITCRARANLIYGINMRSVLLKPNAAAAAKESMHIQAMSTMEGTKLLSIQTQIQTGRPQPSSKSNTTA